MAPAEGHTVFLTEQESERIRNTVKERLKKCEEAAGRAREPRDARTAISDATGASLMADMGSSLNIDPSEAGTLPALGVGQPYPPCVAPLQDLRPMRISDLRMETHHRGYRLTVKRASPVVALAARSWAMVQDEAGEETERVEVCLHKTRHGKELLELASVFVIKEPYFTLTDQGEPTIRIDHPSDLVVIYEPEAKSEFADTAAAEAKARSYKAQGNAALEKQNLPLARAKYTEGLKIARQDAVSGANPDLARDLSRNRAHVNLLLNRLDEAKADALAALIGKDDQRSKELDGKALFRAGMAAYNLGEYHEAKALFERRLQLAPEAAKDTGAMLRRIETRLREQESGAHDLKKLRAGLSRARPGVDAASFPGHTEVRPSPGRGRGLFATRDFAAGDVILVEKAFCVVWGTDPAAQTAMTYDARDDRIRVSPVGLTRAIVQKLLDNPSQIARVTDLYGDYPGVDVTPATTTTTTTTTSFSSSSPSPSSAEPLSPVVDTFRIHDIVSRNAFGPSDEHIHPGTGGGPDAARGNSPPQRHASTGLWLRAAYVNHSCVPNASKEYVGDLLVLRAERPIGAGAEILHSYSDAGDYDARRRALLTAWGFECACALCEAERADEEGVRRRRAELAREAEAFVAREPGGASANRRVVVRAQRLARAIEETYDAEKYRGLPRLAGKGLQEWLARAGARR